MNPIVRREALRRTSLLMGGAVSAPALAGILQGCTPSRDVNWIPKFLSKEQAVLTGEIANRIIPSTETPGALDVGVDQFIDLIVAEAYPEEDQKLFLNGLEEVEAQSKEVGGKSFVKLTPEQQDEVLQKFQDAAFDAQEKGMDNQHFFYRLKELTLLGYFTSEEGMQQNLDYTPVPGKHEGCISLEPDDKLQAGNHI